MTRSTIGNILSILFTGSFVFAFGALSADANAQSNGPVTREQVNTELIQLENAGYNPHAKDNSYPATLQAAEARVAKQNDEKAAGSAAAPTNVVVLDAPIMAK